MEKPPLFWQDWMLVKDLLLLFASKPTLKPKPPYQAWKIKMYSTMDPLSTWIGPKRKLIESDNWKTCIKIIKTKQIFFPETWRKLSPNKKLKKLSLCLEKSKTVKSKTLKMSSTKLLWLLWITKTKTLPWHAWWVLKQVKKLSISITMKKCTSIYMFLRPNISNLIVWDKKCSPLLTPWAWWNKCKWWWEPSLVNNPLCFPSWCLWTLLWCLPPEEAEIFLLKDSWISKNLMEPNLRNLNLKNNSLMSKISEITFLISPNLIKKSKDPIWVKFFSPWSKKSLKTKRMSLESLVCWSISKSLNLLIFLKFWKAKLNWQKELKRLKA